MLKLPSGSCVFGRYNNDTETKRIIRIGGHYQLWNIGWQNKRRIHGYVLHLMLKEGKIWVQHDGIEDGVTNDLLVAGVKENEIVLAFFTPSEHKHLPFAVR